MQDKTCLVSTLNNLYIPGFKVFLKSLINHNTHLNLDYVVFYENDTDKTKFAEFKNIYNKIIFKEINNKEYNTIAFAKSREWQTNPAYRLEIFNLNYSKIIFFDVDAICLKPIDDILNLDYDFAAIKHELHDFNQIKTQYAFKSSIGFNGGFMIVKNKFLNKNTINGLKTIMSSSQWYGNQGPLNIFFEDAVTLLDTKYFLPVTQANLQTIKTAYFVHFLGEKKPWFGSRCCFKSNKFYFNEKYSEQVLKTIDTPTLVKLQKIYDALLYSS
jgi:lipopolysaccharide biosynthesis glycosyltransferase